MLLDEARAKLAKTEAELVAALVGQTPAPVGWDPAHFRATAAVLARKRARSALRACPRRFDLVRIYWRLLNLTSLLLAPIYTPAKPSFLNSVPVCAPIQPAAPSDRFVAELFPDGVNSSVQGALLCPTVLVKQAVLHRASADQAGCAHAEQPNRE
jgi:hypothetical protein